MLQTHNVMISDHRHLSMIDFTTLTIAIDKVLKGAINRVIPRQYAWIVWHSLKEVSVNCNSGLLEDRAPLWSVAVELYLWRKVSNDHMNSLIVIVNRTNLFLTSRALPKNIESLLIDYYFVNIIKFMFLKFFLPDSS